MEKVVAIIPARGGSKAIPKKNVKHFHGKPLIAWSIQQALDTKEIDAVYVSSDSDEILDVAKKYGAKAIKRPDAISGDTASSETAMQHVIEVLGDKMDILLMLQPTSPLRKPEDMGKAIQQFYAEKWDSGFSGALLEDFLIWEKDANGVLNSFNYDYKNRGRRQDRKPQFVENGSIYMFKPEILKKYNNRMGGKVGIALQEVWQSFELDNPEDWEFVETLFKANLGKYYL